MGDDVSGHVAETAAEVMSLLSAIAFAVPALRLTSLQGATKKVEKAQASPVAANDPSSQKIGNAVTTGKKRKAEGLYWYDVLFLWMGIFLVAGSSLVKLIWVIPKG